MADSEERMGDSYESEDERVAAWRWTGRRREASNDEDDNGEEVKEKYRRSSFGLNDESDGLDGALEYVEDREGGSGEELEEMSQSQEDDDEGELQEMAPVNMGKEKKAMTEELFVPRSGWFYMHDDRFQSRRPGRRRGNMTGMKLWNCTDEQKWRHDKFEDMMLQDRSAPKSQHQQQMKNQSESHRYADTNLFGFLDNFANQNNQTSTIVKGRGLVKYKPIVKSNNLNRSSKHQMPAKLQERTSRSSSPRVPSSTLAVSSDSCNPGMKHWASTMGSALPVSDSITSTTDIFKTRRSNAQYGRINKYIPTSSRRDDNQSVSLHNPFLQRKTASNFAESHGHKIEVFTQLGYSFPFQLIYQPYSSHNSDNGIPLPPMYPVIEQGPVTSTIRTSFSLPLYSQQSTLNPGNEYQTASKSLAANSFRPQTRNFGHDLVARGSGVLQEAVRGSCQHGGSPSLLPVMQLGGLPYGAVGDYMAQVGYASQFQLGSRNCGMTSMRAGAARPCNINKPLSNRSASELDDNEFQQKQLKPQRYSKMR